MRLVRVSPGVLKSGRFRLVRKAHINTPSLIVIIRFIIHGASMNERKGAVADARHASRRSREKVKKLEARIESLSHFLCNPLLKLSGAEDFYIGHPGENPAG